MNKLKINIICLLILLGYFLDAQPSVTDFLNVTQLEEQEVKALDGLNSNQLEFAPAFYRDGILFVRGNSEKKRIKQGDNIEFKLMKAIKDSGREYSNPVAFDSIFSEGVFEGPLCFVKGENWLILSRNQTAIHKSDDYDEMRLGIYFYSYIDSIWTYQGAFPYNNKEYNTCHPSFDPTTGSLIFASDMPGSLGGLDLFKVQRVGENSWSTPENLGPMINSPENDCFPFVFQSDYLFYSSDRQGGAGGFDVYGSVNESKSWLAGEALPGEINSIKDDLGLIIDDSGKDLYFASSRPGGMGHDDLYLINLSESIISAEPGMHQLSINHQTTKRPLSMVQVRIIKYEMQDGTVEKKDQELAEIRYSIDQETLKQFEVLTTDIYGKSSFSLEPGDYIFECTKEDFHTKLGLLTIGSTAEEITVLMDTLICKDIKLVFENSNDGKPVEGVDVHAFGGILQSDNYGIASICLKREDSENIVINKYGFQSFDLKVSFDEVSIGDEIHIALRPSEIYVEDLPIYSGEFTVLENILYEFNSAELNGKAKKELDRLAKHMLTYPEITIELSAHTDSRGGEVYNQVLSDERAETAKVYLKGKGIEEFRIAAIGYGESRLRNECSDGVPCSEKEHSINRRTEVKVTAGN